MLGRITLATCFFVTFGGIFTYSHQFLKNYRLLWGSLGLAFSLLLLTVMFEIVFREWRKPVENFNFQASPNYKIAISPAQFNEMVSQGANLVLMNELVLDIQDYGLHHPGGKFIIRNNIGRDISKFYYGAYSIQDNPKHVHSN